MPVSFNAAANQAEKLYKNGMNLDAAVARVAGETGHNSRALTQEIAYRHHITRQTEARRTRKIVPFTYK